MAGEFAVKRKRFSVEQIVAVLKQAELGLPVADLIRQVGISEQTFYRWKKRKGSWESGCTGPTDKGGRIGKVPPGCRLPSPVQRSSAACRSSPIARTQIIDLPRALRLLRSWGSRVRIAQG